MRKLSVYLLSLSLLASCSSEKSTEEGVTGEDFVTSGETASSTVVGGDSDMDSTSEEMSPIEIATSVIDSFQNGNYTDIIPYFDENLFQAVDVTTLAGAWKSTVSSLGASLGTSSVETNGNILVVTAEYEVQNLVMTLVFGEESEISGINLNVAPSEITVTESAFFVEEEVTIGSALPLGGFLTMPVGVEAPPVVLLVQGSGSTDRNSAIYENVPFQDIAHGLAEEGIASLRYDKRFYTYPEEVVSLGVEMTLEDEILDDVAMALDFLAQEDRLGDIYVLGHSLGGMLTPSIATTHSVVQGIISVGGSPRPLYEISYDQNKESEAFVLENVTDTDILEMISVQMAQVEEDILTLRGDFSHLSADEVLMGLPVMYQQSVKDHGGENFLGNITIPILVLQGSEDFQVSPTVDYGLYQDLLGDRENVTFHFYEGLNHLMMESEIRDVSDYQIKSQVDPQVIEDIAHFIHEHER